MSEETKLMSERKYDELREREYESSEEDSAAWRVAENWQRECDRAEKRVRELEDELSLCRQASAIYEAARDQLNARWVRLRDEAYELGEPCTDWLRTKMDQIEEDEAA